MIETILAALLAVVAGVALVTQQALNAGLRTELNSAIWAGVASYVVGLVCMLALVVVLREPGPSLANASRAPWYIWSGGALGALFIAMSILLVPKLGAAAFIALLVAGQMTASVLYDHFGLLGLPQRPLDAARLAGVALLVGGVVLIRR
jgi:transporter family-2 protein